MKIISLSIAALLLMVTGCATERAPQLKEMIQSGKCSEAYDLVRKHQEDIGERYVNMAIIANDCERNRSKAIEYLNYSARLGTPKAAELLIHFGQKVPAPDTAKYKAAPEQVKPTAADHVGAFLKGWSEGTRPSENDSSEVRKPTTGNTVTAYHTGKSKYVTTVSGQAGMACEYQYSSTKFVRTFVGSTCPNPIEVN